jgi:phosphoglycerate dehydrogenase-like enzyme
MRERIFLSRVAVDRWWDAIVATAPDALPVIAHDQLSSVRVPGRVRSVADVADVAWISFDIWDPPPRAQAFFAHLLALEGLTWCHTAAAGVDRREYGELAARGVVLSTSHVSGDPIGDFVLRSVLDVLQDAQRWREAQEAREWRSHEFREMSSTCWLVVGVGAIGTAVAQRARSFGSHVVG